MAFLGNNFLPVGAIASVVALCGGLFIMVGNGNWNFPLLHNGSTNSVIYAIICWDC